MTNFIPPTSYKEASAMMGQTFVCPDGVERRVDGASMSGDDFGVSFGPSSDWSAHWHSKHGFETATDRKTRQWMAGWNALKPVDRDLLLAVFPDLLSRDVSKLKEPSKLVTVAISHVVRNGKIDLVTCGRCGGCGEYSYNQMHGTVCYGCGGKGKRLPNSAQALRAFRCE